MAKMKTNSAAKKRFKKIGKKKIKRSKAYRRHLLTKKNAKRKRGLRARTYIHVSDVKSIAKLLPNS